MIKTKRLKLRKILIEDKQQLFSYRCDAEANKYQGWVPKELKEAEAFIKKTAKEINTPGTWFQLIILEEDTNSIIGDIGLHFLEHDENQVELGITLDKNKQGKGFASEAMAGVINYLFNVLNKHRVYASVDKENKASIKLLSGLGFRKEAHFIESLYIDGQWVDDVIFGLLKREWK